MANNPDPFTKLKGFGTWIKKEDGSYRYQITEIRENFNKVLNCWIEDKPIITEKTPEEMGLTRQSTINVLFLKEYPSRENFDEVERVWFKMPITFTVRADQTPNIQLKQGEKRLFITSIDPDFLMTMPVAFESNENLVVKRGKAVKIEPAEATELAKNTAYIFGKMIGEDFAVCV